MSLSGEAAHLYLYSKELIKINRQLRDLSKKIEKHKTKYERNQKDKHKVKHYRAKKKIEALIKKHNTILSRLHHYHATFHHTLRKEHKI